MPAKLKAKPHYIAYIDVLGYKGYLEGEDANEEALFQAVHSLASTVKKLTDSTGFKTEGFKSRTFSDNILLAVEAPGGASEIQRLRELILISGLLQYTFFKDHDLMLRGSIVYGNLHLDESIVFGSGLIKAVEKEKEARHPRITIDESVITRAGDQVRDLRFVVDDDDKKPYIDWLQYTQLNLADQADPNSETAALIILRDRLKKRIGRYCWFKGNPTDKNVIEAREGIIAKHLWSAEKFNDYCHENGYGELMLNHKPKLNRRLMKYELQIPQ